jgi:dipeptidyl aminopeptidase/acylaminoacyl peptidase
MTSHRVIAGVLILLLYPSSSFAQRVADIVGTEVTTPTGSRGVMVRPSGDGPFPAILHLHGSGDTVANNVNVLQLFARAGYVAMDVEYRELRAGTIDVEDVLKSLEFLNGSRYVRRGVIGVNGFSLGGRLALRVATREKVLAVSAIAARTSSGSTPTILEQAARLTSPILLQHGTDDSVVPYNDSVLLERSLKGMGRRVEFFSYAGAGHNTMPWDQVYEKVLSFFASHLR